MTEERIQRLSDVSVKRFLDPDTAVPGGPGPGQVIPDDLLSVAALPDVMAGLTPEQKARLSREEMAAVASEGIRFEAALTAGFALHLADKRKVTDPRVVYILHEIGEESRHSRLFVRLVDSLGTSARNPFLSGAVGYFRSRAIRFAIKRPVLLYTLILAGEEIPDLMQKQLAEHPDTDPFIREVSKYHRQEEARHLAFARTVLPDEWKKANAFDKALVRYAAPVIVGWMFKILVHPGVYASVDLPAFKTWRRALSSEPRIALRKEATANIVKALVEAGAFKTVPKGWQHLTGVTNVGKAAAKS